MASIKERLEALERASSALPWLVLEVIDRPTSDQQADIDKAIAQGRTLIVFVEEGNTMWMPGRTPPWEQEGGEHGNA